MTIHTVVLTSSKRQGVAYGQDELHKPIRIWLLTPRAVRVAMLRLEHLGKKLHSYAKTVKPYDVERVRELSDGFISREWDLR